MKLVICVHNIHILKSNCYYADAVWFSKKDQTEASQKILNEAQKDAIHIYKKDILIATMPRSVQSINPKCQSEPFEVTNHCTSPHQGRG